MKKVMIQQLNLDKEVRQSKKGTNYQRAGVKIDGTWYNGFVSEKMMDSWRTLNTGQIAYLTLYETEKDGAVYKNFKFPTMIEMLMYIIEILDKDKPVKEESIDEITEIEPEEGDLPF